jgi:hypothetical protein
LRQPESLGQLLGDDRDLGHRLREVRAASDALGDGVDDQRMSVPDDHHAEAVVEVDVLVAVDVPNPAAAAVLHEDRLGGRVLERRWHSTGTEGAGLAPKLVGSPSRRAEGILLASDQGLDTFRIDLHRRHLVCHIPGIVPGLRRGLRAPGSLRMSG